MNFFADTHLAEVAEELSLSTTVDHPVPTRDGWYWQTDDGRWRLFDQPPSKTIEDSRRNDPHSSVQFTRGKHSYVINLKTMIQTNTVTGKQRSVVRVGSGVVAVESPAAHLWFWKSRAGRWYSFHADDSEAIEKQFAADSNGTFTLSCNDRIYSIDLKSSLQTNVETDDRYPVKRVPPVVKLAINGAVGKTFIWQWLNDDDDNWETFDADYGIVSSEAIETAFVADKNAKIAFHCNSFSYIIDLKELKQTNESSAKERRIRRIKFGEEDSRGIFPATWTNVATAADLQLIPISSTGSTANEYSAVVKLFAKTMPDFWLTSVKRIQNRKLYQRFHLYRSQLEERIGSGKGIRHLFHGTSKGNIDAICQQGFDFRLKSTYAYGQGSYFARDAYYSYNYSDCSTMFIAQVTNHICLFVCLLLKGTSALFRPLVPRIVKIEHTNHVNNDLK